MNTPILWARTEPQSPPRMPLPQQPPPLQPANNKLRKSNAEWNVDTSWLIAVIWEACDLSKERPKNTHHHKPSAYSKRLFNASELLEFKKRFMSKPLQISLNINLPVISDAGNMVAIMTEGHRANPAVICSPSKYGRGGREKVPALENKEKHEQPL